MTADLTPEDIAALLAGPPTALPQSKAAAVLAALTEARAEADAARERATFLHSHAEAFEERAVAAEARLAAVRALHPPIRIYDECDHDHPEDWDGWIDAGDFLTCAVMHLYTICTTCCTEGGPDPEQSSWCADHHDHTTDPATICATVRALDGTP